MINAPGFFWARESVCSNTWSYLLFDTSPLSRIYWLPEKIAVWRLFKAHLTTSPLSVWKAKNFRFLEQNTQIGTKHVTRGKQSIQYFIGGKRSTYLHKHFALMSMYLGYLYLPFSIFLQVSRFFSFHTWWLIYLPKHVVVTWSLLLKVPQILIFNYSQIEP